MTNTAEKIKVMQASVNGKQIQQIFAVNGNNEWCDSPMPIWNWYQYNYRIKPEPKYKPLKPEELIELKGKWLKGKNGSTLVTPIEIHENCIYLASVGLKTPQSLFDWYTFEDDTPVGKLEE